MARSDGDTGVVREDLNFLDRFERCELPEFEWTHLAHVRLAWICLSLEPEDKALARIREGILRYNTEVLHRRHKYHETVTVAFTRIVAGRMQPRQSWADFAECISDIMEPGQPLLLRYYSERRLYSDEARRRFVEPDREDLPDLCVGKLKTG